jgi:hypothetical protein
MQNSYKTITTPIGRSMWTKLATPETRFVKTNDPAYKQGGYFEAVLRFAGAESQNLRNLIQELHDANLKEAAEEILEKHLEKYPKQKGKIKDAVKFVQEETEVKINPVPFKQIRNEDGDLIDEWEIKAKMWARGTKTDKQGNVLDEWDNHPTVRNPANHAYDEIPNIGNGSKIRAVVELAGYRFPSIGIRIRLVAVQVWELVEYKGGGGFDDSEFDANPEFKEEVVAAGAGADDGMFNDSGDEIPF